MVDILNNNLLTTSKDYMIRWLKRKKFNNEKSINKIKEYPMGMNSQNMKSSMNIIKTIDFK